MEKNRLLNTYVNNMTMPQCITAIENLLQSEKKSYVVEVNVDVIMKIEKDQKLKKVVDEADLCFVDGKPLIWISRLLKTTIQERIAGSDLVPLLCERAAEKGYSIFILGGQKSVAEKAAANLKKKHPSIQIAGTYSPPLGFEKDPAELNHVNQLINAAHPDFLITCFGCPKQEFFIADNISKYNAKVSICAGATVDFLAGNVKRAPKWMQNHGFEWFYRFLQEPKRLFKRYFVDDMKIIGLVWKYRNGEDR